MNNEIDVFVFEDGGSLYLTYEEACEFLKELANNEENTSYTVHFMKMQKDEFNALPEFEGF